MLPERAPLDPKRPCDTMRGPPGEGFHEVPGHTFFLKNRPLTQKCSAILPGMRGPPGAGFGEVPGRTQLLRNGCVTEINVTYKFIDTSHHSKQISYKFLYTL